MNKKLKVVLGAICALVYGLCLSNGASGQTLPDANGKAEFIHNCTACHSTGMVLRANKTPDEWKKTVDDMVARGVDGSKEDIDNVLLYLDKYFVTDKSASAATAQSTTPSSNSGGTSMPASSDIEHVRNIITSNGCLSCHRIESQGGYIGPTLNGVGKRRTTDEIRAAVVSPRQTVEPSNNVVRLTTADGNTLVGRILSQDDHNMRVINASGEVTTISKPDIRESTVVNTNPMPSFGVKISGADLENLVRYLGSLPPLEENVQK